MFIEYNPNPVGRYDVGDCAVRAIAKALNISWEDAYLKMCVTGFMMGDLPNSDSVFGALLRQNGFNKKTIPDTCPECYTINDFARDNSRGTFVVGTGNHAVTIIDGNLYDSSDSSKGIPIYYWYKSTGSERINGQSIPAASTNGVSDTPSSAVSNGKPATGK